MKEQESIPIEYTKERPPVFDDKESSKLVRDFALRYGELRTETEQEGISSTLDLIQRIEASVGSAVERTLPPLLKEHGTPDAESEALIEAAKSRDLGSLDFEDKEKITTALGLALVAERARTRAMRETLNGMNEEELHVLGMTPDQRDIVTGLLGVIQSANPEYMRFKIRAMRGELFPEKPMDAIREEQRIAEGLRKVEEALEEKGPNAVFGPAGRAFADFLRFYAETYRPLDEEGQPVPKSAREKQYTKLRTTFEKFLAEHPDFPLILFPRGDKYVSEGSELALGRDPEIRLSWQSPDLRKEAERLQETRSRYTAYLRDRFGPLLEKGDTERIQKNIPIVAGDLGYFGIGMQVRFEAQELKGTSILFKNVQMENRASTKETIQDLFGEDAKGIADSPGYYEIADTEIMLHEWAHQIHEPKTRGAKNLGKAERKTNETKSDLAAYAALYDTFEDRARELYGDRALEALNQYIIGYAVDLVRNTSPDGEERPYYVSSLAVLNRLAETGIIREEEGTVVLAKDRIRTENFGQNMFEPQLRELLTLYHKAEKASGDDLRQIRRDTSVLGEPKSHPLVEALIRQKA